MVTPWNRLFFEPQKIMVLDEVCEKLPRDETGARTHVACKILEAARTGEATPKVLRQIGRKALAQPHHVALIRRGAGRISR